MDYTPVQRRILKVLADGEPHDRAELHACLVDDLGPLSNIRVHLTRLRKKLRPQGQDIRCEMLGGQVYYRQVRLTLPARKRRGGPARPNTSS